MSDSLQNESRIRLRSAVNKRQFAATMPDLTDVKSNTPVVTAEASRVRLLFVVEGNTDIRFVCLLSEVSDLTILIPREHFRSSGLQDRLLDLGLAVAVHEIPSARIAYQLAVSRYLWHNATRFDVILGQEMLRGSLSATVIGRVRGIPVLTYMCLPPAEYFRCRRSRGQISWPVAALGQSLIQILMTINGSLARGCIALGPYLEEIARKYSGNVSCGLYYGVDTDLYRPCTPELKASLRRQLALPRDKFLILFSSRLSHEKDPETVLQATAIARQRGLDCAVVNLSGEYRSFVELARKLGIPDAEEWVIGRPPAHPMGELAAYYCSADCLAQASLEEGLGMSPLEALACGIPAVCSSIGGLKANLGDWARLVPVRDPEAMAGEFLWVRDNAAEAREEALAGRRFVNEFWSRQRARIALATTLDAVRDRNPRAVKSNSGQ